MVASAAEAELSPKLHGKLSPLRRENRSQRMHRKRICEEVVTIVRERVPRDEGAPGLLKLLGVSKHGAPPSPEPPKSAAGPRETLWADQFSARCAIRSAERAAERRAREAEIRSYRPQKIDFTMLQYVKLPPIQEPRDWQEAIWERNRLCEFCVTIATAGSERVECRFCNVVAHARCALPSSTFKAQLWMCDDCIYSLEECRRRQIVAAADHQCLITQHIHATIIQAMIRRFVRRMPHLRLRRGMVLLQGAMRCHYARTLFRDAFTNDERPYNIKVISALNLGPPSDAGPQEFYAIVSLVPTDSETQRCAYQFTTRALERDDWGNVEISENFLVPCTVCGITCYVTLVSKPQGVPANETPVLTFHGQTSYDLEDDLLYFKKVTVDDDVGAPEYEPREKPGFSPVIRMVDVDKQEFGATRLVFEMLPCPNATTLHGPLDEVSSVFSRKAVKRKWWCLLVEEKIYFYRLQSNPTPVLAWPLGKIGLKIHEQSGVIELKYGDKTMLVSHGDTDMRNKWISLLRSNADAMRAKATTKNRRRSTAMTKGGTRRRSSFSPTSTPNESVQNTPVQTSRRLSKS